MSFMWNGEPTKVGDELTLPNAFANEMKSANKVVLVDSDPTPIKIEPSPPPNVLPPERVTAPTDKPKGK